MFIQEAGSVDNDQSACLCRLIFVYATCQSRNIPGSAGEGLNLKYIQLHMEWVITILSFLLKGKGMLCQLCIKYQRLSSLFVCIQTVIWNVSDCERGFSAMKRIKTDKRNQMCPSTLNALLLVALQGPPTTEFPYEVAIDKWAKSNRRLSVA